MTEGVLSPYLTIVQGMLSYLWNERVFGCLQITYKNIFKEPFVKTVAHTFIALILVPFAFEMINYLKSRFRQFRRKLSSKSNFRMWSGLLNDDEKPFNEKIWYVLGCVTISEKVSLWNLQAPSTKGHFKPWKKYPRKNTSSKRSTYFFHPS